jgi:hypothetical protein
MTTEQTKAAHDRAMILAGYGDAAQILNDPKSAQSYYAEALVIEREAAESTTVQPDRAILLRYSASLALGAGDAQESLRLASMGLDEAMQSPDCTLDIECELEHVHNAAWSVLHPKEADTDPTTSPEISPDSLALKDARAVLKAASNPTILPADLIEIGIITDRHGICVTINKGAYRLFTSRRVKPDQLVDALGEAAQFAELGMPYDDGCMAAMSVRNWMARLSVVADLRRILGVTV